jgi:FAD/FMN-containing dehydrogenase
MARRDLISALTAIVGSGHVLTDEAVTKGYRTDWTGRWEGRATAVVRPASTDEVSAVVRACAGAGVAVVPQGGNTGLVGASIPHDGEVLLSLRRLDAVDAVDPVEQTLAAGAGTTVAAAQAAAAQVGLMLGIDLAARESATLGGAVATNAGGLRVVRLGATRAQLLGIEAVLADGSVLRRWTGLVKDNVGYDLVGLLTGSEGTLGVVTRVLMRLVSRPAHVHVVLVGVASLAAATEALAGLRRCGLTIEAAEYFHSDGLELVTSRLGLRAPFGGDFPTYLLVETSGLAEADVLDALSGLGPLLGDATVEAGPGSRLWAYREGHTEAISAAAVSRGGAPLKVDVAVPLRRLAAFEAAVRDRIGERFPDVQVVTFGHLAEGNAHVNLLGLAGASADEATDLVLRLVIDHGGSISAEHGVGRAKQPWLSLARSPVDIAAMRAIKNALDPGGILSPGVLLPPPVSS